MNKQQLTSRVPEITIIFWLIKVLSTTVGETGADFLSENLGLGLSVTSCIMGTMLMLALIIQFKIKRYLPVSYWTVVILMSIEGTLITDKLVDDLGVSLITTSIVFTVAMILGFIFWYKSEKTLSIHSINTSKREAFYWVIILLAFALGTAGGDLISERLEVGYTWSLIIFGTVITVVTFAYYKLNLNSVWAFWIAFIMTRPLGASIGDLLTQAPDAGGLGLSNIIMNIIFFFVIISLIVYLSIEQNRANSIKINSN